MFCFQTPPKKPPRRRKQTSDFDTSSILSSPSVSGAEDLSLNDQHSKDEPSNISDDISNKLASPNSQDKINNNKLDNAKSDVHISTSQECLNNEEEELYSTHISLTQTDQSQTENSISNPIYMTNIDVELKPSEDSISETQTSSRDTISRTPDSAISLNSDSQLSDIATNIPESSKNSSQNSCEKEAVSDNIPELSDVKVSDSEVKHVTKDIETMKGEERDEIVVEMRHKIVVAGDNSRVTGTFGSSEGTSK